MRGLNLAKFKKVSGDKDHTVLSNEDGHQIRILHKPLGEKMKKSLMALPLAEGGKVDGDSKKGSSSGATPPGGPGSPAIDKDSAAGIEKGATQSGWQPQQWVQNLKDGLGLAKGGEVKMYADSDQPVAANDSAPVQDIDLDQQQPNPMPEGTPTPAPNQSPGEVISDDEADSAPSSDSTPPPPSDSPAQVAPAAATPPPVDQAAAAPSDPFGVGAMQGALMKGIGLEQAGIAGQAKAAVDEAKAETAAREQMIEQSKQFMKRTQEQMDQLNQERQGFMDDIKNSHIDPRHYLGSMDTVGRVSTAIGLMLGGISSGISGGPNQALEFLNKQIDRDIDAQKSELGKKETLLSANFKQFNNLQEAAQMTRVQMNDLLSQEIGHAASQAKGPQAIAAAQYAQGQIYNQTYQILGQFAMKRSIGQMGQQPGTHQIPQVIKMLRLSGNEPLAKYYEDRYVPSLDSVADQPVSEANRDRLTGMQTFQEKAQNLMDWSKKHQNTVLDRTTVNEGKALAADLQGAYRQATHGGVYKESEQHFINSIVPSDPTAFFNKTRFQAPLKAIQDSVRIEQQTLHKNLGLPGIQMPTQYKMVNGIKYMRGPNGEAVPVK